MAWWNNQYLFRRRLTIGATESLVVGQNIVVDVEVEEFVALNKVLVDYEDIEIIWEPDADSATPTFLVLSRLVTDDSITFTLVEGLDEATTSDGQYWIYYGNPDLDNAPVRPVFTSNDWPSTVTYDNRLITYTRPAEDWVNGKSSTRNAKATFEFSGTAIRLNAMIGPDQGRASIYIDEVLDEVVDLYYYQEGTQAIYSNLNLTDGPHMIQVFVAYEKAPESTGYEINLLNFEYVPSYEVLDQTEEFYSTDWVTYSGGLDD